MVMQMKELRQAVVLGLVLAVFIVLILVFQMYGSKTLAIIASGTLDFEFRVQEKDVIYIELETISYRNIVKDISYLSCFLHYNEVTFSDSRPTAPMPFTPASFPPIFLLGAGRFKL
jgi:hypothetical protein